MSKVTSRRGRILPSSFRMAIAAAVAGVGVVPARFTTGAPVSWTGTGGQSWATSNSWSPAGGPGTADTVTFNDTASSTLPGDVTSFLDANRTIGALTFTNATGKFHTLDFNTKSLTVNGNLNFNTNASGTTTTTLRNGSLTANYAFGTFNVARAVSATAYCVADLSGLSTVNVTEQEIYVGTAAASSLTANGTLYLGTNNNLTANAIYIGSSTASGDTRGTIRFGMTNNVQTPELDIGKDNSTATATIVNGGFLTLGSTTQRTSLQVGIQSIDTNNDYTAKLDLTGGGMTAYLSQLIVGQRQGIGTGDAIGIVIAGSGGTIQVGATGSAGNFYVGRTVSGASTANGTADFSASTSLTAVLNDLQIGYSTTGSASGTVKLAGTNNITANTIVVGSGNGSGTLALGQSNTIVTGQLTIGSGLADGTVTIPAGGTLNIGSSSQRTALKVGGVLLSTNNGYTARLDLSGATLNGYFGDIIVADRDIGGFGGVTGTFNGGSSGTVNIGTSAAPANFYVARNSASSSATATGTVDFSGLSSMTANLNAFGIAISAGAAANGTVKLPVTNTIIANSITVGSGGGGSGTLALGTTNTILANTLSVAIGQANGTVTIPNGGTLNLGSTTQRTTVVIGSQTTITNNDYTGRLDLTGGTLRGYLADVTVGLRDNTGNVGGATGFFIASAGTVDIGVPGNTSNFYVGQKLTSDGDIPVGTVDFGGLTSLNATLNNFTIGTAQTGSAKGTVTLAQSNTIDAVNIIVGSSGGNTNSLALGKSNTILVSQFSIGVDGATGQVTIPVGGALQLGSPSRLASLTVGSGSINDNNTWTSTMDLTGASLTAYLDVVTIGQKSSSTSTKIGTLTISSLPGNFVSANSITLGTGSSTATGTLNFGGGQLYAGSISKGGGTGNFNWTGGVLSVGTFGVSTNLFNLNNSGSGTLSPGTIVAPVGTTTINGNYTQGANATTAIDIAGASGSTGNDLVAVTGTTTLAGTLKVNLLNGFTPTVGQNFLIGTHTTRSGTYAFVSPPSLPPDVALQVDYTSNAGQIMLRTVAPVTQNLTSTAANPVFATAGIWDNNTVPATTSSLTLTNAIASPQTVTVGTSTTVHRIVVQGNGASRSLEVPAGIKLGVSNSLVINTGGSLTGGGQVIGNVSIAGGGTMAFTQAASNFSIQGRLTNDGTVNAGNGGTLTILNNSITNSGATTSSIGSSGSTVVDAGSTLTANSIVQQSLTVNGQVNLQSKSNGGSTSAVKVLTVGGVTGAWTGKLDLADSAMVIDYDNAATPIATIADQIKNGRAGGAWTGNGITSSSADSSAFALGYAEASAILGPSGGSFGGRTVDGTSVLVRYTRYGDANLDGAVNGSDLSLLLASFGQSNGRTWNAGDFNYDGAVNGSDLSLLLGQFGQNVSTATLSSGPTQPLADSAPIPEPATASLAAAAAGLLLLKRRAR